MSIILGLCGLSGVGKSTARRHLVAQSGAEGIYLGAIVLEEVRRRHLEETPENEGIVRVSLRKKNKAEIVIRGIPTIKAALEAGRSTIVDAILLPEELDCLRAEFPAVSVQILKVQTSMETRLRRLASRAVRPLDRGQVEARDGLEFKKFKTDWVLSSASHCIDNDGSLVEFHNQLDLLIKGALL